MDCKLCGAAGTTIVPKKVQGSNVARVRRCDACDYFFLTDVDLAGDFYKTDFETFMADRAADTSWTDPETHYERRLADAHQRIALLERHVDFKRVKRALELGCSTGFLLQALKERHPHIGVAGVEPGERHREYARTKGFSVVADLTELREKFDFVVSYFVLEHITDPEAWLRKVLEFANPGAQVVTVVPNVDEALVKAYHDPNYDQFVWQAPHLSYFTAKSLDMLFSRFTKDRAVIQNQRYSLSNHLNWLSGIKPKRSIDYPHITPEIDRQYKAALEQHGLADCLIGVMRLH